MWLSLIHILGPISDNHPIISVTGANGALATRVLKQLIGTGCKVVAGKFDSRTVIRPVTSQSPLSNFACMTQVSMTMLLKLSCPS